MENTKVNKVLLDFDGVVTDLNTAIKNQLKKENINFNISNIKKYNYSGDIGCDRKFIFSAMANPETYVALPFYQGAKEAITLLKKYTDVYAYTGSIKDTKISKQREQLIADLGLKGKVYFEEKPIFTGYDALFDDCLAVHQKWQFENIKHYLINQPYNQEVNNPEYDDIYPQLIRCSSLLAAVKKYLLDSASNE